MLLLHIIIATTSIATAAAAVLRPTQSKLMANHALVAATFVSGIGLIIMQPAHLSSACLSGLSYLAVVAVLTAFAQRKFAHQTAQK